MIEKLINSRYLEKSFIDKASKTLVNKKGPHFLVLDNFFNDSFLSSLIKINEKLNFKESLSEVPFHHTEYESKKSELSHMSLFHSIEWFQLLSRYLDHEVNDSITMIRKHNPDAMGFWPHSDICENDKLERMSAFILYLNREWKREDGGLFQIWKETNDLYDESNGINYRDNHKTSYFFLEDKREINVEVYTSVGLKKKRLKLVKEVIPSFNRVIIGNYRNDPFYHSITPSRNKERHGVIQWHLSRKSCELS